MAGHNKWSKVKHKKAKTDARKGKVFTRIAREIQVAVRSGGDDPQYNAALRACILAAKAVNMPADNIDRAVKRGLGLLPGQTIDEVVYEGYGPEGVAMMVACLTDNRNRTAGEVRHAFSRAGGSLGETNSVAWMFDRRGLVQIEDARLDEDAATELAIEVGADDVRAGGEDGVWEIICAPDALGAVRQAVEAAGRKVDEAKMIFEPRTLTTLGGEAAEKVLRFHETLEELDDVQEIFANFELSDAELERLADVI